VFDATGTGFPVTIRPWNAPIVPDPIQKMRNAMRKLEWTIEGAALDAPIVQRRIFGGSNLHEVCLPEGDFTVTLKAIDELTDRWAIQQKVITVQDIFVVQLGDSYASGEGTPERRIQATVSLPPLYDQDYYREWANNYLLAVRHSGYAYTLWADDGGPFDSEEITSSATVAAATKVFSVTMKANVPKFSQFSEMHRQHYRSHRSSFAASSQFALEIENQSDKSSITFVNLAMSGATTNDGVLGSFEGRRRERFYDPNSVMSPQLTQLKEIANKRPIDVLLISIGGNDAGFANAAAALVIRDGYTAYHPNLDVILHGVKTGNWGSVENSQAFFAWYLNWSDLEGLNRLPAQYAEIPAQMDALGINANNVYVTEYPNFARKYYPSMTINTGFVPATIPARVDYCEPSALARIDPVPLSRSDPPLSRKQ
jgi:lysophospholipase L1-like esterase